MKRFLTSCSVTRAWLRSRASLGLSRATHLIRAMHDFVTKLALLSNMWGSVSYTICPYPSRIITGSASIAEKVPNFPKPTFPKKGVGKFSKNTFLESPKRQLSSGMLRLF